MSRTGNFFPPKLPRTERGLRACWAIAIKRVEDAQSLGWRLYEQSWQATLDAIEQSMRQRGYTPPSRELRHAGRILRDRTSAGHPVTQEQLEQAMPGMQP